MTSNKHHWNNVYSTKPTDRVGWYTPHLDTSLSLIKELKLDPNDAVIDVGGGASTLVDDLLAAGYSDITVLDLSTEAIQLVQGRLGERAGSVTWITGDVAEAALPANHYRVWHDRAVFHFLVRHEERDRYKRILLKSLRRDGYFVVGAFAPEAPPRCSGLPVQRYSAETLSQFFAGEFELQQQRDQLHVTPSGVEQPYVYCLFKRLS